MRKSMSTTSGRKVRAMLTAVAPSPASPTTSMFAAVPNTMRIPSLMAAWSSAISTAIGFGAGSPG